MSSSYIKSAAVGALGILLAGFVQAAPVAVATYDFHDNTLSANEAGVASLGAINPLGSNTFLVDTVFGDTKNVYRFDGSSESGQQGGVSLNTTGLLSSKAYSVDMTFSFDHDGPTWQRILDASNRSSDNGFYVEPGDKLQIYPIGDGPTSWTFGAYHRVSMTNNGLGHVTAYLDGIFQFDLTTTVMDFDSYLGNPSDILTFFADNTGGPAQTEWVPGKVSLIRLYDTELTSGEVGGIGPGRSVPEPSSLLLLALGLLSAAAASRRRLQ